MKPVISIDANIWQSRAENNHWNLQSNWRLSQLAASEFDDRTGKNCQCNNSDHLKADLILVWDRSISSGTYGSASRHETRAQTSDPLILRKASYSKALGGCLQVQSTQRQEELIRGSLYGLCVGFGQAASVSRMAADG